MRISVFILFVLLIFQAQAQIISTFAGNGGSTYLGNGIPATLAEVGHPRDVAVDGSGNVYIGDWTHHIRVINASTGIITTIAGNGSTYSGDGGPAVNASFFQIDGVAVDANNNVYIADCGNNRIRKITSSTGIVTTIIGTGVAGYSGDGGPATSAQISAYNGWSKGLCVDGLGNIYFADCWNDRVRKVDASTGIITTIAGNGIGGYSGDGGPATSAQINHPMDVTVDGSGNVYFVDGLNVRVRKINTSTGVITTVAGNGNAGCCSGDGIQATSSTLAPVGVAIDIAGNLYITDGLNNRIRKVNVSTGIINTVAGNSISGFSGDGGIATSAQLNSPDGIAIDASSNIFIADESNNRIRKVQSPNAPISSFIGSPLSVNEGASISFTNQSQLATSYSWTFPGGTPSSFNGQTPPPIQYNTPGVYDVTLAVTNSFGNNTHTELNYVNVLACIPVADFNPTLSNIFVGGSVNFIDQSSNSPTTWQWTFTGGTPSTWTGQTPPAIQYNTAGTYEVTLTVTNACGSNTFTAANAVTSSNCPLPIANFTPTNSSIAVGGTVTFTDQSTNTPTSWQWAFTGGNTTTWSGQSPPAIQYNTAGTHDVTLTATNVCGSDTFTSLGAVTVSNCPSPVASFNPTSSNISAGGTVTFNDLSTNTPTSWQWTFAGGTPHTWSGQTPPPIHYANAGTYSVTLIVTNSCGFDDVTVSNAVVVSNCPVPVANFVYNPATINTGETVNFADQSTNNPTSWQWTFTGGANPPTSTLEQPSVVYPNAGLFDVHLVATNSCGSSAPLLLTAIVHVGNVTPSTILIRNEISGNPALANPVTLFSANTNQIAAPPVKICADGSASTKIYVTNNSTIPNNQLGFYMASDPVNNNPDATGTFATNSVNGNQIEATLNHPKYWGGSGSFRLDTIVVCNLFNSSVTLYRIPVQVCRAPVIFVHGLGGNSQTFFQMENDIGFLSSYPSLLTYRMDYEQSNTSIFLVNTVNVKNEINGLLLTARNHGYSVGKVDYVGHSMGGILGRLYLQGSYISYQHNINKLITVNTPHSGSQWANTLITQYNSISSSVLWALFQLPNLTVTAIDDLRVDSYATDHSLNGTQYLNNNTVPSHSLITDLPAQQLFSGVDSWLAFATTQIMNSLGYTQPQPLFTSMFDGEANDLVVAQSSQTGGLSGSNITSVSGQAHIGSTDNPSIISAILNLLKANPSAGAFANSGFLPTDLNPLINPSSNGSISRASSDIQFISPANNTSYSTSSQLSVNIVSSGNISKMSFACYAGNKLVYSVDSFATQLSLSFTTPADYIGKLRLIALGYDASGFLDIDTLSVINSTTATLDSISFYPEFLNIPISGNSPININGYFNDGVVRNLNHDPNVQYTFLNNSVATHTTDNLVHGQTIDTTTLLISYSGITKSVPVQVFQGDIVNALPVIYGADDDALRFSIYPNPNTGQFSINIKTACSKNCEISCFNLLGEKVYANKYELSDGQLTTTLNLSMAAQGLYIIQISTDGKSFYSKVTITE